MSKYFIRGFAPLIHKSYNKRKRHFCFHFFRVEAVNEKPEVWLCDVLLHISRQVTPTVMLLLKSLHIYSKVTAETQLHPEPLQSFLLPIFKTKALHLS